MTCRERLKRVFMCREVDRMPVRIDALDPLSPRYRKDWDELYLLTEKYELEILRDWIPLKEEMPALPYNLFSEEKSSALSGMKEITTFIESPDGKMTEIYNYPEDGSPGYIKKHFIEDVNDAKKYLSLPEQANFPAIESYLDIERKTGGRAMLMIGIDEAAYAVQRLMGSELFGYWLYDERDLLRQLVDRAYREIEKLTKHYLSKISATAWVGSAPKFASLLSLLSKTLTSSSLSMTKN